jgi:hypothetical protein
MQTMIAEATTVTMSTKEHVRRNLAGMAKKMMTMKWTEANAVMIRFSEDRKVVGNGENWTR